MVLSLERLALPLTECGPPAGWRAITVSYCHQCCSLACVFHSASLVLQEPSKNSRSAAPLRSSNQYLAQTDLAEQPQTDLPCEDKQLHLPRAVLLLPWQSLPVVGYRFCVQQPERSPPVLDCSLMQSPFPEFCLCFAHTIRELRWWKGTSGGPAQGRSGESRFFRALGS